MRSASKFLALAGVILLASCASPPPNAKFDYQLGGDYPPPAGVTAVSRDWFSGHPLGGDSYSICYVNAFQTQADEEGVDRPDERSNWPADLVLNALGDDPNWGGEYLIDISTPAKRSSATEWVTPMVQACADAGFKAVEYDNLDSWTRFDGTPLAGQVPFGQDEAVLYAEALTDMAHARGLAVAQKNTPQLSAAESHDTIGFDLVIAEECGRYNECSDYVDVFGDKVIDIEYTNAGFTKACNAIGADVSVVRRDVNLSLPGSPGYRYDAC